jgi:hypothetical protein
MLRVTKSGCSYGMTLSWDNPATLKWDAIFNVGPKATGYFTSDRDCEIALFEQLRRTTLLDSVCLLWAMTSSERCRRRSFHGVVDGMSLGSYCFNEAVLGSCACRGFVLFAAGAFLVEGLLTLLACCSCFWSFLPTVCLADAGFTCAVLA